MTRPVALWLFDEPMRAASTAVLGGGLGARSWVLNAEVAPSYGRLDPAQHLREIAAEVGLSPHSGAGMLTAASLVDLSTACEAGVCCDATVGLSFPIWAAAPEGEPTPEIGWRPGTINLMCVLPLAMCDAAMVNAVATATEAKSQALLEAGVAGTGTASDAIVICCPRPHDRHGEPEQFCGPRSTWGSRLARVVHSAVAEGVRRFGERRNRPLEATATSVPSLGRLENPTSLNAS